LGRALAPLRRHEGIFIVGSGGTTHNLFEGLRNPSTALASPKAIEFAKWVRKCVLANDSNSLMNYKSLAPHAEWAHPSLEHYLPLLVAMGASTSPLDDEKVQVMEGGYTYGVLAMDAYLWG
jgi:4,5-DOPA dioxygenase extradiol